MWVWVWVLRRSPPTPITKCLGVAVLSFIPRHPYSLSPCSVPRPALRASVPPAANHRPAQRVTITRCGPTDRHGTHEALEDAAGGAAGAAARAQSAAARLAEASAEARSSVL